LAHKRTRNTDDKMLVQLYTRMTLTQTARVNLTNAGCGFRHSAPDNQRNVEMCG